MEKNLIAFAFPKEGECDATSVRGLLLCHIACQRARLARELCVALLTGTSLLLCPLVFRPRILTLDLRSTVLMLWTVCFMGLLIAAVLEMIYRRRRARFLDGVRSREPGMGL